MKKKILAALLITSLIIGGMPISASNKVSAAEEQNQTASQAEMQLKYDTPATEWQEETLPLGNGFLGATIYGGVEKDRIVLNEHTLWAGGPGANAAYNGGHSDATAEENYANLAYVRKELQKLMNDFTANSSSYVDEAGNVVSKDYPALSDELTAAIEALEGKKTNFGKYQELGELQIMEGTIPYLIDVTTNCNTTKNPNILFDGIVGSSSNWFSCSGNSWGTNDVMPAEVTAQYSVAKPISGYSLTNGYDNCDYGRSPVAFNFYGSNNGDTWDLLDEQTELSWTNGEVKSFALSEEANYSYYKLSITANEGVDPSGKNSGVAWGTALSEITFHEPENAELVSITHNTKSSVSAEKVIDGAINKDGGWFSAAGNGWGTNDVMPAEITLQYSAPKWLTSYTITTTVDSINYGRSPESFNFYGSDDGSTWTLLDARADVGWIANNEEKTFDLASDAYYSYYKLSITANEGVDPSGKNSGVAWGTAIAELELNGPVSTSTDTKAVAENYIRTLGLDNAVANVSYTLDSADYTREYFVSNPGNVMAIRLAVSEGGTLNKRIMMTTPQTASTITAEGDTLTITGRPSDHKEGIEHLEFAGQVKVVTDGTYEAQGNTILVTGAKEVILYFTAGTNYQQCIDDTFDYFSDENPLDAVKERLSAASTKGYTTLKEEHIADYTELYDRVTLNFGSVSTPTVTTNTLLTGYQEGTTTDEENRYLEALVFQYGRYLLIASSREGSLPANLQGIWAQGLSPRWNCDYHTNINIQMNYWAAENTNLAETHQPMIDYINAQVARGKITAQQYHYSVGENGKYEPARGWTTYHENNIWGHTAPSGSGAFYFPIGAAWLCQHIWEQYEFNQDKEQLRKNFDTMLEAAIFWVDNLVIDERDGTLVSSPTRSPEHGPYSLGDTQDQVIVWQLFTDTLKAAEVLGYESTKIEEIRAALDQLSLPKIGKAGQFQEWKDETTMDITGDGGHRHVNHLYALYPGNYISSLGEEQDIYMDAIQKVLETRGEANEVWLAASGWSRMWRASLWARLGNGDQAGNLIGALIKDSMFDNLFSSLSWHNDYCIFQIDANLGYTACVAEMLLQSDGDAIELLPALPEKWSDGEYTGLKARGNVEVDLAWSKGTATTATLRTATANDALKVNGANIGVAIVTDSNGNEVDVERLSANEIQLASEAGETYTIDFTNEEVCKFVGRTLELGGKIGVNFYIPSNHTLSNEAYVEFTLEDGEKQTVTMADTMKTEHGVRFTCWVPAKEMADTITATIYDGGKVKDTVETTVRDYAETIISEAESNTGYAAAKELVNAMLNYGAYAQKLFVYNTGDLANKNEIVVNEVANVEASQLAGFAQTKQGLEGFGSLYGASLVLKEGTKLRMFFAFEEDASLDNLAFSVDGVQQEYTQSGEYYIVEIADISAYNLDTYYTVDVINGDKEFSASCSAMTFCYNALMNTDDADLHNVAKALYLYNKEADAYVGAGNYEARIGETYYVTFEEAVATAAKRTDKPIVNVLKDIGVDSAISIAASNEMTIQSEGENVYTITGSSTTEDLFDVEGTLTVNNLNLKNGKRGIYVNGGTLHAKGVTITGQNNHGLYNEGTVCGNDITISNVGDLAISNSGDMEIHGLVTKGTANKAVYNSGKAKLYQATIDGTSMTVQHLVDNNGGVLDLNDTTLKNAKGTALYSRGNATSHVTNVVIDQAGNNGIYIQLGSTLSGEGLEINNVYKNASISGAEGNAIKNLGKITMLDHVTIGADDAEVTGSGATISETFGEFVNNALVNDSTGASYSGSDLTICNAPNNNAFYNKGTIYVQDFATNNVYNGISTRGNAWATLNGTVNMSNTVATALSTAGPESSESVNGVTLEAGTTVLINETGSHAINNKGSFIAENGTKVTIQNVKGTGINGINNTGTMTLGDVEIDGVYISEITNSSTFKGNAIMTSGTIDLTGELLINNFYYRLASGGSDCNENGNGISLNGGSIAGTGSIEINGTAATTIDGVSYKGVRNGIYTSKGTIGTADITINETNSIGICMFNNSTLNATNVTVDGTVGQSVHVQHANTVNVTNMTLADSDANGLRLYTKNATTLPKVTIEKLIVRDIKQYGINSQIEITSAKINISEMWYINCLGTMNNVTSDVVTPKPLAE